MASSTQVCPTCRSLEFEDGQMSDLDIYVSDLLETGEEGCLGCNMLLNALNCCSPTYLQDLGTEDGQFSLMVDDTAMWMTLHWQAPGDDVDGSHIQILWELDDPNGNFYQDIIPACLAVMPHSGVTAAFERVKSWLDHCSTNHTECRPQADKPFHPKRLIDVNSAIPHRDGEREDFVRVVEFPAEEQCKQVVTYAALSYCWGSELTGVLTTTKLNLAEHCRGILVSTLPTSIADAIAVCRGINVRYLWADSLCIVQDDDDDWRRESSRMGAIYMHSHVTIAAHRAASCLDGFLGQQRYGQPDWQQAFTTRFWPAGMRNMTVGQEPAQVNMILRKASASMSSEKTEGYLGYSALMRRGWTLQEGLLPQRIIHYTEDEMAWECLCKRVCECGHVTNTKRDTPLLRSRVIRGLHSPHGSPGYQWMQVVKEYTTRQLSRSSDKLVALSGLAKFFIAGATGSVQGPHTDPVYLAGVYFSDQPVRQLLWHVNSHRISRSQTLPSPRPSYRAPTWSWASIDSPVRCPAYPVQSHITMHNKETFCKPLLVDDPTGAVTAGQLVVSGALIPVILMTTERPLREPWDSWMPNDLWSERQTLVRGPNGCMHAVSCDIIRPVQLRRADPGYKCWTQKDHLCAGCCPSEQGWEPMEYACLKVATETCTRTLETYFLVLRRLDVEEAWERVGLGTIFSPSFYDGEREGRKKNRQEMPQGICSETVRDLFEGSKVRKIRII
ncbi:Heterokaryon incompatibility protein (HET) domain containing protein [Rhypophila decipiens]